MSAYSLGYQTGMTKGGAWYDYIPAYAAYRYGRPYVEAMSGKGTYKQNIL